MNSKHSDQSQRLSASQRVIQTAAESHFALGNAIIAGKQGVESLSEQKQVSIEEGGMRASAIVSTTVTPSDDTPTMARAKSVLSRVTPKTHRRCCGSTVNSECDVAINKQTHPNDAYCAPCQSTLSTIFTCADHSGLVMSTAVYKKLFVEQNPHPTASYGAPLDVTIRVLRVKRATGDGGPRLQMHTRIRTYEVAKLYTGDNKVVLVFGSADEASDVQQSFAGLVTTTTPRVSRCLACLRLSSADSVCGNCA